MELDFDVEASLIASIYMDNDAIFEVADSVDPGDFANVGHGVIYDALRDRVLDDLPNDVVSVVADLRLRGTLETAGEEEHVKDILTGSGAEPSSARHYGDLIRNASKRRTIASLGKKLAEVAATGGELGGISATLGKALMEFSCGKAHFVSQISESADDLRVRLHALRNGEIVVDLLKTGFADLDNITKGLRAGQLIIVGARPGMGKTAFALELGLQVATATERRVLFFSLEMSTEELSERAIASAAKIHLSRLQTGDMTDDELSRVDEVVRGLKDTDLVLNSDPTVRVSDIRLAALREQARGRLGLIVVDYLQLMGGSGKGRSAENRQIEVADISRSLKLLARELEVPVIALSQLSRNLEIRHDKRP